MKSSGKYTGRLSIQSSVYFLHEVIAILADLSENSPAVYVNKTSLTRQQLDRQQEEAAIWF
jgi:hypothetical protein